MDVFLNQPANPFQTTGTTGVAQQRAPKTATIPGLKVAYGVPPSPFGYALPDEEPEQKRGLFSRIGEALFNLVTEEAENELPIGISQLSRQTFQASWNMAGRTFVRAGHAVQDYRFNQLVEPR